MPFQGSRQPVCPPAEKNLDLFPLLSNSLIVCLFFFLTHILDAKEVNGWCEILSPWGSLFLFL